LCESGNRDSRAAVYIRVMDDEIKFLRDAAEELRRLAQLSPEIAEQLLRLAVELEPRHAGWKAAGSATPADPEKARPAMGMDFERMVGVRGFEPPAPTSRT
jgi:hypothetical protein